MTYEQWLKEVPELICADTLWNVEANRMGLFICDLGWHDVSKLSRDRRTRSVADQLYRALGGISATIAEGFSRGTGVERARFYEFALGSAREARDWYFKARHILGEKVIKHRTEFLTRIIRLTLKMIPDQRRKNIRLSRSSSSCNHVFT